MFSSALWWEDLIKLLSFICWVLDFFLITSQLSAPPSKCLWIMNEWKASKHLLQIIYKYLLVLLVEEQVLSQLGAWINWFFEEHIATCLVLLSFCRQNGFLTKLCLTSSVKFVTYILDPDSFHPPLPKFWSTSYKKPFPSVAMGIWQLSPKLCTILWQAACCFSVPRYLNEDFALHSLVMVRLFSWLAPLKWGVH